MGPGPTVDQYHFDAWDLPTKYGWMHSGPGVESATLVQDVVRRMSERMIASGELVGGLLDGAQWVGAAAAAAGQAMRRGAGQIDQNAAEAATAQRCVAELGESFAATQHRVPAPNEVPTGLGNAFLYGAAEGFNALSPFDVQSPLHEAMEQRRELDHQANLALTDHMTTSRERVEAMPEVAPPAPITVAPQNAGASGVGGVESPAGAVPAPAGTDRIGGAPAPTPTAGWGATPVAPAAAGVGPAPGVSPLAPGPAPRVSAPPSGVSGPAPLLPGGGLIRSPGSPGAPGARPAAYLRPPPAGPGTGGAAPGGHSGSRVGEARGSGFGGRSATGGDGVASPGGPKQGAPGPAGPAIGGPATPARGGGGAGRPGPGSFLQPPLGSRGSDDVEHHDRYAQHAEHIVGELPLVAPAVIGETPEEENRRLRRTREGQ